MKKLLCLIIFTGLFVQASAQFSDPELKKNEISLNYGIITLPDMFEFTGNTIKAIFGFHVWAEKYRGQNPSDRNINDVGCFTLGYNRFFNDRLSLGLSVSYQGIGYQYIYNINDTIYNPSWQTRYYTAMLNLKYNYLNFEYFRMYFNLGIGGTLYHSVYIDRPADFNAITTGSGGLLAFQFTPVGLQVGKRFGGFLEFGLGSRGTIQAGLYGRF